MERSRKILGCGVVLMIMAPIFLGMQAIPYQYRTNLDIRVSTLPAPVVIDGKQVIYYELIATNFGTDTIRLKTLTVSGTGNGARFAVLDEEDLKKRACRIGTQGARYTDTLLPGSSSVIYLEVALANKRVGADRLAHRLRFETTVGSNHRMDSVLVTVPVSGAAAPVIGPPLGKGNWAAVYEPSWRTGHRRVIYTVEGRARIPGRYAIDFIQLDRNGRLAHGDDNQVKDWYGYGADVLAVADGIIAAVRTDFLETPTVAGRERVTAERATGNYVSIDLGNNTYAFYEHLKPGSIRVRAGQKVKKGQIIGSLGFTGQSNGPHLHFHLADKNSPLGAEGIPFCFDRFTWLGSYSEIDSLGRSPWVPVGRDVKSVRRRERPVANSVIAWVASS